MVKLQIKAINKTIEVDRLIGHLKGEEPGPCVIFMAGIHGNEPAGVFALYHVLETFRQQKIPIKGSFYAISGNLPALESGERFQKVDLNRLWTTEQMNLLIAGKRKPENEDMVQQEEIFKLVQHILNTEKGPFYFMDIHSTSSPSIPFLPVNDSLLNRKFAQQYPLPIILGIEEFLDGPILSYINELGYVAFGFECGQHGTAKSIENGIAFIYLSLVFAELLDPHSIDFKHYFDQLKKAENYAHRFYEIYSRYAIQDGEAFRMKEGFQNFQRIKKGQGMATSNGKSVMAEESTIIFMPLYQSQGHDGFFNIRKTPLIFLKLSTLLRNAGADHILLLLPGVQWADEGKNALKVDLRVARFFAKKFFHLLGYRAMQLDQSHLLMKNRERASRREEYKDTKWFN